MGEPSVLKWLVVHRYGHACQIRNVGIFEAESKEQAIEAYIQTQLQCIWHSWEVTAILVDEMVGNNFYIQMPKVNYRKYIVNPLIK